MLDSLGGDVDAAMAIGRVLRSTLAVAGVFSNPGGGAPPNTCASACVLVLAGATDRTVTGRVGIHRLYTTDTATTDYESLQRTHRELEVRIRSYLREMNIPESLYDAMTRYASEEIHFLTKSELAIYHLDGVDPVLQDLANSRAAAKYGISKQEYLRRVSLAKRICNPLLDRFNRSLEEKYLLEFFECDEDVKSGRQTKQLASGLLEGAQRAVVFATANRR
jgi:hypothetical protein